MSSKSLIEGFLIDGTGGKFTRRQDGTVGIEKPEERCPGNFWIDLVGGRSFGLEDTLQLGQRVPIQILDILFFQSRAEPDRVRKCAAFFGDRLPARLLQRSEKPHLVLKLRVEAFLVSGLGVSLREIKRRAGHYQHD